MTVNQHLCIENAIRCLQDARKWMDSAMYYSDGELSDDEFKRVREAYDFACNAIDKL